MPDLDFTVMGAEVLTYAAAPTLLFKLHIENRPAEERIQAIMLRVQIRIEAPKRRYAEEEQTRLLELFGEPKRWGDTLRNLLWTHTALSVSHFTGECVVEMPIACTYDFEVVASKYLAALENGEALLLFLFSGTVLYARDGNDPGGTGLQIAQIPWEKEAAFRMPVRLWHEVMDHYFPQSAWLRVRKDVFDRLCAFKASHAFLTWEDAIERLLDEQGEGRR